MITIPPIQIIFDQNHNAQQPTLILATRSGKKLGVINTADDFVLTDNLSVPEISMTVFKELNGEQCFLWNDIRSLRLVWAKEWDKWFEIVVDIDEDDSTKKNISGKGLGASELSRIYLYNTEINTESDILREDYEAPTVLYDVSHPSSSLLHRILEKAPHYSISHVDSTIADIQRTFSWDGSSITEALDDIAEEIGCLVLYGDGSATDGSIARTISVYDLMRTCADCGHRGTFSGLCPECGGSNIIEGYGEDTTILVSSKALGKSITVTEDIDSYRTCLKLIAGDDYMTATIAACNPNGSQYLWRIPSALRLDMSSELSAKLEEYDTLSNYYNNEYQASLSASLVGEYNLLVAKYQSFKEDLQTAVTPIEGFPSLVSLYYDTIDFGLFLENVLMPAVTPTTTTAAAQLQKCLVPALSPIAISKVTIGTSQATVEAAIRSAAKRRIMSGFSISLSTTSYDNNGTAPIWTGTITITNDADKDDIATSSTITIYINDDYQTYLEQSVEQTLTEADTEDMSISGLFAKEDDDFALALKDYSMVSLESFLNCCKSCLDVLVAQGSGEADSSTYSLYESYLGKQSLIEAEMDVRQAEIDKIYEMQDAVNDIKTTVQENLDFESFLGETLLKEFSAYRMEGEYQNDNYISDGLSNAEIIQNAIAFLTSAQEEMERSATVQCSVTATLNNLLTIPAFLPLVDHFQIGNWIRVIANDEVYRLRLIGYTIQFSSMEQIEVELSDVTRSPSGLSDVKSVLDKAENLTASYGEVSRQASSGATAANRLYDILTNGLELTQTRLIDAADNQDLVIDQHGLLARRYSSITDTYEDEQLRLINSTIALTDDGWQSVKTAIGKFYYQDPVSGEYVTAYGINGEVVGGKLILGNQLGIYSETGSMTFDRTGLTINAFADSNGDYPTAFSICKDGDPQLYIDSDGNITMSNGAKIIWGNIDLTDLILTGSNVQVEDEDGTIVSLGDRLTYIYSEYANFKNLTTENLDAINANIENLEADTIKTDELEAAIADIGHLDADSAFIEFLEANLVVAGEIDTDKLKASLAEINVAEIGSVFATSIQSLISTTAESTIDDAYIQSAIINKIYVSDLIGGTISTNKFTIASDDGTILIQNSTQYWKDENGVVRMQAGLDANGDFTFSIFDASGTGVLIDAEGIHSGAIADDLVTERMLADNSVGSNTIQNGAISSGKIDWASFSEYVNEQGSNVIDISEFIVSEGGLSYKLGSLLTKIDTLETKKSITVQIEASSEIYDGTAITLTGHIYNYGEEISEDIPASKWAWTRESGDSAADLDWATQHTGVKSVTVNDISDTTVYSLSIDYSDWEST